MAARAKIGAAHVVTSSLYMAHVGFFASMSPLGSCEHM